MRQTTATRKSPGEKLVKGHRKVNGRRPKKFRGLGLNELQLERFRAMFA